MNMHTRYLQISFFVPNFALENHSPPQMKDLLSLIACLVLLASCGGSTMADRTDRDSTAVARRYYEAYKTLVTNDSAQGLAPLRASGLPLLTDTAEKDALHLLLDAADFCHGSSDHALCYSINYALAREYEAHGLYTLQQKHERAMLSEAQLMADAGRTAEARQQMAVTAFATDQTEEAIRLAQQSLIDAPRDSVDFRAQTLLFLAQAYLEREATDSAAVYLQKAKDVWPDVATTDLFHLTSIYIDAAQGHTDEAISKARAAEATDNLYSRMEQWRLVKVLCEERGHTDEALMAADKMLMAADSIRERESGESAARIHALQHETRVQQLRAETSAAQAHVRLVLLAALVILLLVGGASYFVFQRLRRKARRARAAELEALRLTEEAVANEETTREENQLLQRRYYEHLFAIILPILNARRKKSGVIDLTEQSWRLIEENTDLVLPGFTRKLHRQHPELTLEDLRFCCLVTMRVPNAVLADIYAISTASVAVKKQRMKRKFDDRQAEQNLEDYLDQYGK